MFKILSIREIQIKLLLDSITPQSEWYHKKTVTTNAGFSKTKTELYDPAMPILGVHLQDYISNRQEMELLC